MNSLTFAALSSNSIHAASWTVLAASHRPDSQFSRIALPVTCLKQVGCSGQVIYSILSPRTQAGVFANRLQTCSTVEIRSPRDETSAQCVAWDCIPCSLPIRPFFAGGSLCQRVANFFHGGDLRPRLGTEILGGYENGPECHLSFHSLLRFTAIFPSPWNSARGPHLAAFPERNHSCMNPIYRPLTRSVIQKTLVHMRK